MTLRQWTTSHTQRVVGIFLTLEGPMRRLTIVSHDADRNEQPQHELTRGDKHAILPCKTLVDHCHGQRGEDVGT